MRFLSPQPRRGGRATLKTLSQPVLTRILIVAQQERRTGDLGQDDVEEAVAIFGRLAGSLLGCLGWVLLVTRPGAW
ncbi:MAG: hypothetical protein GY856_07735 [bacterium]|nr:hypothetical protein [bacterium]